MPSPSNIQNARQPRTKSKAQQAKAAANKLAYEARCAALKAGTFKGVVELAAEAAARSEAERAVETAKARQSVVEHMAHPVYGQRLTRFIGQRPGVDPCVLLVVVNNWKRTQGL
jgi:hypothetical protein